MKKIFFILILILPIIVLAATDFDYKAIDSAESFFKNVQTHDYSAIWEGLSNKSKNTIVDDVYDSIKKSSGDTVKKEIIEKDFDQCGQICTAYWTNYIAYFNADAVLVDSQWSTGESEKNYCEIQLNYKTSDRPAIIKMYKENGKWKVGLTESFWLRKLFM